MALTVQPLTSKNLDEAIALLKLYGAYMYEKLLLRAGKANFYDELGPLLLERYKPPTGEFIIAYDDEKAVGCVALKKWREKACEMKRMFVLPEFRNRGIGRLLTTEIIRRAEQMGYEEILLDTNAEMEVAVRLYQRMGFVPTTPYVVNENTNVIYLRKILKKVN